MFALHSRWPIIGLTAPWRADSQYLDVALPGITPCRKRVREGGAVGASEERILRFRPGPQEWFSNCFRLKRDSVRSPYHQYQVRLFRQYRPDPDIFDASCVLLGTM